MRFLKFKTGLTALLLLALVGCGGGAGSSSGTAVVGGGGSSGGTTAVAADLTLALSAGTLKNSGTDTLVVTATAVDANRNTVSGISVALAVDSGAIVRASSKTTDTNGQVTGTIGVGDDPANRTITVTATSGDLTRTRVIQVIGAKIIATALPQTLLPSARGEVQFRLVDSSDNPIANKTITVTGPGGVQTTDKTLTNGDYTFKYDAPSTAGNLEIRASAAGVETVVSVLVQAASGGIPNAVGTVQSGSLAANPSVVAVNAAGSTINRTELRALFLAPLNLPIGNIRVAFDMDGDKQSIGGSFSSVNALVYSDASGVARSAYIPGARFSAKDGVTVRACWDYRDFVFDPKAADGSAGCPHAVRSTLTVTSDALSVTIGTNAEIILKTLTYQKQFVIQVVDGAGIAAKDVQISASVDLTQYWKGSYRFDNDKWIQTVTATCDNEDVNRNGAAEVFSNGQTEDANGSYSFLNGTLALDPHKADVAVSFPGSSKTDTSGQVVVNIEYPQNVGSWDVFNLVVSASGVGGTEGRGNYLALLPVLAKALTDKNVPPPFIVSPYGVETSPVVIVSEPGSSRPAAALCTNKN